MEANKFITNQDENMLTQMNSRRIMTDDELKVLFGEGKTPNHVDYECLIDSKANVQDIYTKKHLQNVMEAYYGSSPEIAKDWYDKEMKRRASEEIRNTQETTRQNQEQSRQTSVQQMRTDVDNKIQDAENKIVNVEGRMVAIENQFDSMVDGTGFATQTYVDTKVAGVVNSAPETLDTLNELAAALGNDPNFATTIVNKIGTKADTSYVNTQLGTKSNTGHTHTMDEIEGLSLNANAVNYDNTTSGLTSNKVQGVIDEINTKAELNKTSILSLEEDAGDLTNLQTNDKASLVAAINEVFQSANNGKDIIANAIGSPLVNSDTFAQMGIKIDALTQSFKDILKEKGLEVIPNDKMLSLIEKAKELARRGSGYLPNQPFTCELGYMDLPQKFIFMHYYDDKMKLFCRDDSRRGDIYYNTIDLKTGVDDGWQKTSDSNLGIVVNSYRYPIRGKHSENNWVARETSSGARYRKVDSSTFATTQITELNDCVTTRTSAIYRVGDILYYFKVTSPGTGIYVKLNSYDLTTNIVTELYDFKSQLFNVDPKSITVDGDNLYFHLSKQGENRNVYFYKYSLTENSLEELGVAQVNDINLNLLNGSYIIYKKDKLYVISGYLTGDSNRCKILEFDIQSKLYKSHIFSLGHSSLGPNMLLENYVTGDNENIWLTGVTSLETDTLFLRLNIN